MDTERTFGNHGIVPSLGVIYWRTDPPNPDTEALVMYRIFPNVVTGLRLAMAIVVLVLMSCGDAISVTSLYLDTVLVLFVVAMLTDWVDGYLARKLNAISQFGRMLDPFVDKVLICGLFILLSGPEWGGRPSESPAFQNTSGVPAWLATIIVIRELLVSMLRGFGEAGGFDYSARFLGKMKLCTQTGAVVVILLVMGHLADRRWALLIRDAGLLITLAITILSSAPYLKMTASRLWGERRPSG